MLGPSLRIKKKIRVPPAPPPPPPGGDPDQTPHSAASGLGLRCLPMSHKKDARFKWVKTTSNMRERSGSVVVFLTRDRGAAGSSLTGVTTLWSLSKTHLS